MCIVQHRDGDHPADFDCAQAGCRECVERLIEQHAGRIPLIVRWQWPGKAHYADLIQEGWIGLWLAVLHFDSGRGIAFLTYARRAIRNRVWNAVRQAGKAEEWLEPQRAGDNLTVILASRQQEQLHQVLQDELSCLPERLRLVIVLTRNTGGKMWPVTKAPTIPTAPANATRINSRLMPGKTQRPMCSNKEAIQPPNNPPSHRRR